MFEPASGPRIFGLPPGVDFAAELAAGVLDRLAGQPPEALAQVTIHLNTDRMRGRVRAAFQARGPGFLPRLRLLSDIGADPGLDAPPAVSAIRRRLELSLPVARLLAADPQFAPGTAIYDLADRLAGLADEMQDEGVTPAAFEQPGLADDHAAHWERSLAFLRIIAPWFDGDALPDAATRQRRAAETLIARWRGRPPADPVLIAGSTGSRGTTQLLMQAVAALPQGALVLPGFDFDLPEKGWNSLMSDGIPNEDHPQFRHARLMALLDVDPAATARWTGAQPASPARNRLISLALRPAPVTDQWLSEGAAFGPCGPATQGLALIEAPNPRTEALAVALALREAAETGRRAALITPDQTLVRRVTAALDRWSLVPDNSGGEPLHLSPPGRFLRQIAGLFGRPLTVEGLLALLKHPVAASGGGARGDHLRHTRNLELHLRRHGPPFPTAGSVREWGLAASDHLREAWCDWLAKAVTALPDGQERSVADWLAVLADLAERLAADPGGSAAQSALWQAEAGEKAAAVIALLRTEARFGGTLTAQGFSTLLARLLAAERVRATHGAHPLVTIQGSREAREVQADLVILGGLNEGVWPQAPAPDPWLSRQMRLKAGLLLPERQIGLAAHDFQMASATPEVILSRAVRDDEAETVPSRWLDRMTNLIGGLADGPATLAAMRGRGSVWLDLAQRIEATEPTPPAARPAPRPPVAARPRELPVTAIRTLIRDPYAVYARYVLRLRPLDPLWPEPDARLRGQVLHRIVEGFVRDHPAGGESPAEARRRLLDGAERILAEDVAWPSAQRLWLARIARIADRFILAETARGAAGRPAVLEKPGAIDLPGLGFRITARPDRIDQLPDGRLHIYDYKTGTPPTRAQQQHFDKQLLIEAAMAERGAFADVGAHPVAAVTYIHLGGSAQDRPTTRDEVDFDRVWAELQGLVGQYLRPARGYTSRRAMFTAADAGDYDHLARFGEWQASDDPLPEDVG